MNRDQKASLLKRISQKCSLAADSLVLNADSWVVMSFRPDEKYDRVSCALAELKRAKVTDMGFIGNEAYEPESK